MQHKKTFAGIVAGLLAVVVAIVAFVSVERVPVGYVGVVYSAAGVEDQTLAQGWHLLSPLKKVSKFPVSQQQIVFSDDPADYGEKEHADWSIDAPADGGMVKINLTVNYNFMPDRVVELFNRFNGMNGETLVESRIQNSIIAYDRPQQGGLHQVELPPVRRRYARDRKKHPAQYPLGQQSELCCRAKGPHPKDQRCVGRLHTSAGVYSALPR